MTYRFLKGHGTENDFVLLPDADGSVHGDLSAGRVRALCDRHAGIGADGVLRAVRQGGRWFMDYRNADGSVSEMCGNGVRVFARYLVEHEGESLPVEVDTRAGTKVVGPAPEGSGEPGDLVVDMGVPDVLGHSEVSVGERSWSARHVSMGNPHAVAFVDDLDDPGPLLDAPLHDAATYPDGVNVEFVVRRGAHHVAMRVHERGSGETRSCGTGACAVVVATALEDAAPRGTAYAVDLPGGRLRISWDEDDHVRMAGPALIVAQGETDL